MAKVRAVPVPETTTEPTETKVKRQVKSDTPESVKIVLDEYILLEREFGLLADVSVEPETIADFRTKIGKVWNMKRRISAVGVVVAKIRNKALKSDLDRRLADMLAKADAAYNTLIPIA